MTHDETHDTLMQALTVGDIQESSREVKDRLASCSTCRETWQALGPVVAKLHAGDAERMDVMREAAASAPISGAEHAESALREAARQEFGAPPNRGRSEVSQVRRRFAVAGLAAAAILVGAFFSLRALRSGRALHSDDGREEVSLGASTHIDLVVPIGGLSSANRIEWRYTPPPAGRTMLRVEGREQESDDWRVLFEGTVRDTTWTPPATSFESWPPSLRCIVRGLDSAGHTVASSDWQLFSRSR